MYGCMDVWMYGCMDVWMYGWWRLMLIDIDGVWGRNDARTRAYSTTRANTRLVCMRSIRNYILCQFFFMWRRLVSYRERSERNELRINELDKTRLRRVASATSCKRLSRPKRARALARASGGGGGRNPIHPHSSARRICSRRCVGVGGVCATSCVSD